MKLSRMKRFMAVGFVVAALAVVGSASAVFAGQGGNGNGVPSGAHYNLNIIGVENVKTANMTGNNGHRIFVALGKKNGAVRTKINLSPGPFEVLDANGTDGTAVFQLPVADDSNSGTTTYSVFARALGIPGGSAKIMTCAENDLRTDGIDEVCSLETQLTVTSTTGKGAKKFQNVSKELLYIYANVGNGPERFPLFDSRLEGYFWAYDNEGLRLLQLRFYQCSSTVPDANDPGGATGTTCFD